MAPVRMVLVDATVWVPLASAVLAVVGVLLGQMMANRRAAEERREQWQQERQRWAREDAARTYDRRRDAYAEFSSAFLRLALSHYGQRGRLGQDTLAEIEQRAMAVHMYGSRPAWELAQVLRVALIRRTADPSDLWWMYGDFMDRVRRDLGVLDDFEG